MENLTLDQYKKELEHIIESIKIVRQLAYKSAQKDTGQEFPNWELVIDPIIEEKIEFLHRKIKELENETV